MRAPDHHLSLETLIGEGLRPLLSELRLIDLSALADYVTNGREACLTDIVASAAEPHYAPGFVRYDGDAGMIIDWDQPHSISIAVALSDGALDARVRLFLRSGDGALELQLLETPDHARPSPAHVLESVRQALSRNCLTVC